MVCRAWRGERAQGRDLILHMGTAQYKIWQPKIWIVLAAIAGASGVALGAYISHGLGFITPDDAREAARASLQSAVLYQLLHALALLGVGIWAQVSGGGRVLAAAGTLLTLGIVLFCGLIYARHLAGFDGLRAFVPWGGGCFILGWICVGISAFCGAKPENDSKAP